MERMIRFNFYKNEVDTFQFGCEDDGENIY